MESLEQLNSILTLLEDLQDMENKIDDVYRPIEVMYEDLRYVLDHNMLYWSTKPILCYLNIIEALEYDKKYDWI